MRKSVKLFRQSLTAVWTRDKVYSPQGAYPSFVHPGRGHYTLFELNESSSLGSFTATMSFIFFCFYLIILSPGEQHRQRAPWDSWSALSSAGVIHSSAGEGLPISEMCTH